MEAAPTAIPAGKALHRDRTHLGDSPSDAANSTTLPGFSQRQLSRRQGPMRTKKSHFPEAILLQFESFANISSLTAKEKSGHGLICRPTAPKKGEVFSKGTSQGYVPSSRIRIIPRSPNDGDLHAVPALQPSDEGPPGTRWKEHPLPGMWRRMRDPTTRFPRRYARRDHHFIRFSNN